MTENDTTFLFQFLCNECISTHYYTSVFTSTMFFLRLCLQEVWAALSEYWLHGKPSKHRALHTAYGKHAGGTRLLCPYIQNKTRFLQGATNNLHLTFLSFFLSTSVCLFHTFDLSVLLTQKCMGIHVPSTFRVFLASLRKAPCSSKAFRLEILGFAISEMHQVSICFSP